MEKKRGEQGRGKYGEKKQEAQDGGNDNSSLLFSGGAEQLFFQANQLGSIRRKQQRLNQSVMKQSVTRNGVDCNVFLESSARCPSSAQQCKYCGQRWQQLNDSITQISSKLNQLESKISLCFTKQAQHVLKTSQQDSILQQIKYLAWQGKQKYIDFTHNLQSTLKDDTARVQSLQGDIDLLKLKVKQFEKYCRVDVGCLASKMLEIKVERQYRLLEDKLLQLVGIITEVADWKQRSRQQTIKGSLVSNSPIKQRYRRNSLSRYHRDSKGVHDESTHISFSRNTGIDN